MKNLPSITILGICCSVAIYLFLLPTKTGELEELKTKEIPPPISLPANNPPRNAEWARYEIRIQNRYSDERLKGVETVAEAVDYLQEYANFHLDNRDGNYGDLFVYDLSNGQLIADPFTSDSYYEIRIQNDSTDERLETVKTLEEALAYLKRYAMHHNDLFVYETSSGTLVAGSSDGNSFEMAVD